MYDSSPEPIISTVNSGNFVLTIELALSNSSSPLLGRIRPIKAIL